MSTTSGYDNSFLPIDVPVPYPTDGRSVIELPYVHFTVLLDPARRLAAATGVNIDGAKLLDLERADDWYLDPRVPVSEQAGPELYARNDLDRGHLVRRRDPVWGERAVAQAANDATFVFTNAAPQAAPFNQGQNLWVGLEDHVLNYARAYEQKISVFTGPVLAADDVVYRDIQIPRMFWKIAAWTTLDQVGTPVLRTAGFVLDQGPSLDDIDLSLRAGNPPPLGPFLTYQVPVAEIGSLTGLDVEILADADQLEPVPAALPAARWKLIESATDITL
ncbi:endonuclease G [Glaciihabitans tibetensis]|uniref:Endonuclease G n=1 Tax=Glaciihabitans tibetensis TaxID=1266600 RepID=A0A2T0VAC8_9MICO|nr:DNA/RNA non-specific endonuclease [Glaciihabitans tibetensis]PRY67156.1 endonuclease G [Glaciihabitans tibetensis]